MLDIKFVRENKELVKENIKKKFQDEKLVLVDEVIDLDKEIRAIKTEVETLKAQKNKDSKAIGQLMREGKKDEAMKMKDSLGGYDLKIKELDDKLPSLQEELQKRMYVIPNIVDKSVPVGRDDSENVENERFGEPVVPPYEIPYHADIIQRFDGLDKESAGRTSGNGFYYLCGDIARLHSAMLSYARDFMINKGFTYCIPPFMIHSFSMLP